ncbi:MAG TPA: acyl-CoA dehydrogenase family protein, partial [Candidatus Binataceae bacterium]|nr:acyl-CoA dehydrogenase family protein [Candidatus Binataceae bacterium]
MDAIHALDPQIRKAANAMEAERRLPDDLARALMEAGVFRMGVPREYGGSECDPMTQVRVVEELSRIEGSVGWLSMISSAGSCMAGFVEPRAARRLFGAVDSVVAGQVRPPQRADVVEGGFRLSGTFHFASGCHHASVMVCGCIVYENGQPRMHRSGQPEFRAMLIPRAKVQIVDVWDTTGMRGTGSNDFVVDDVFIPSEESATMFERPYISSPLYRWAPLYLVSHAGVPLGIARNALDFVEELAVSKEISPKRLMRDDASVEETLAWAEAHFGAARTYVYSTLETLWQSLCSGDRPTPRQRAEYRMMLTYSHQVAKQVVSTLYDVAATSSIFRRNPLDRNLRDIMTACQHRVVHLKMYRPAGRLLLGLEPEEALF